MTEPVTDPQPQPSAQGIERLVARLLDALQRHDATACADLFTADGLILSPYGPPARGTTEIEATHQSWFDEGETNKRLTLLDASASGDLAYRVLCWAGDYPQPDGTSTTLSGRSVTILRRTANGDWKIAISSLNTDPA